MLGECKKKEYFDCVNSKGKSLSAESLFLILIIIQQKMINEMIEKLRHPQTLMWHAIVCHPMSSLREVYLPPRAPSQGQVCINNDKLDME